MSEGFMYGITTAGGAVTAYNTGVSDAIAGAFRTLLETKHLYQSVTVEADTVRQKLMSRIESRIKSHVVETGSLGTDPAVVPWYLSNDTNSQIRSTGASFTFLPSHAKLFCRTCGRIEAYNNTFAYPLIGLDDYQRPYTKIEQVYSLGYLCQSCKDFPEVFLVRRVGGKLTLVGRTPIEHVSVPSEIPKSIANYYSGAVVAHQSGQTLAAL